MTDNPLFIAPSYDDDAPRPRPQQRGIPAPLFVAPSSMPETDDTEDEPDDSEDDEIDSREAYLDEVEAVYTYYVEAERPQIGVWRKPGT